jgi:hypothetical protein
MTEETTESRFQKNVRKKREANRKYRLAEVHALLKSGEDVPFAHFEFALQAYRIDGQEGLWTLIHAERQGAVRAFSMWESDWRHFVPVGESRMIAIADRIIEHNDRPF